MTIRTFAKGALVAMLAVAVIAPSLVLAQSALVANITSHENGDEVTVGQSVNFVGTVTGGTAPYSYRWTFSDDSSVQTSPTATRTFSEAQEDVSISFMVTDHNLQTNTKVITVDVVNGGGKCTPLINELDLTNPEGNHPRAINITKNSATIVWTTCEAGTSRVVYGTQSVATPNKDDSKLGYEFTTTLDSNKVTSHSVELTDLQPNTRYYFRVLSAR